MPASLNIDLINYKKSKLFQIIQILNYADCVVLSKNILKITPTTVRSVEMLRSMLTAKQTLLTMKRLLMSSITSNKWLGLLKGLDQKQWQITNVVKLRVAGMEDARL